MKRRDFLAAAGAIVVGFTLRPSFVLADAGKPLPGSLKVEPYVDGWISLLPDGRVEVMTGKAELGQGIKTALIQIAAHELQIDPSQIRLQTADTAKTANEGYTAGSHSMQDSGTAIRHAAARVRALLVDAAATKLAVPAESLSLRNGTIGGTSGARMTYAEAARGLNLHVQADGMEALQATSSSGLLGRALARVDIPAKVTGGAAYVQDLVLPAMVHGRVVRPPTPHAELVSIDQEGARRLPGVQAVLVNGTYIAVAASDEYQAVQAARHLADSARWNTPQTLPEPAAFYSSLSALDGQSYVIAGSGDVPVIDSSGPSATFTKPFQAHASIGPSCAVALNNAAGLTVWTHTQGVYPLRQALAELLSLPPDKVRCIHVEGSGCYGHNGADDVAADAALLAAAMPGRPVRLQWMRSDEHAWEPYGPPMTTKVAAQLNASGQITAWDYHVYSGPHNSRPGKAGDLLAGRLVSPPFPPTPPKPIPQPEGGGDRNAIPYYAFPSMRVVHHFLPVMPLRTSALRSLGAWMNVFSIESFVDELAQRAHRDPLDFRLAHLADDRAREVLMVAADRIGWRSPPPSPRHGRGLAFARYKNLAAYAAVALELEYFPEQGQMRIGRVSCAVDCGEAVNPDGIRNQMEGGIVQSISWTTIEALRFDRNQVISRDWSEYPILRFPLIPESIHVEVINRPGTPFLGVGEAAQGPTAAALANALASATGRRYRTVPLNSERLRTRA